MSEQQSEVTGPPMEEGIAKATMPPETTEKKSTGLIANVVPAKKTDDSFRQWLDKFHEAPKSVTEATVDTHGVYRNDLTDVLEFWDRGKVACHLVYDSLKLSDNPVKTVERVRRDLLGD